MRKKALPIGILFMVLVVLLAGIGISYGYWSETLTAEGHFAAGNLNAVFLAPGVSESELYTTGVGTCNAWSSDSAHKLNISVSGVYPGYACTITTTIKNNGTVPVDLNPGSPPYDLVGDAGVFFVDPGTCDTLLPYDALAPGNTTDCWMTVGMSTGVTGYEGATGSFTATIDVQQDVP